MSSSKRRKVYIDARVQGALARRIILHWVGFLFMASLAACLLQFLSNPFRPMSEQMRELWYTHGPFIVVMLFLLPVFVIDTIKVSHRFAGPIFNLRRTMRDIADGKPARRLRFRSDDFWHDLSDDFNAMLARLGALDHDDALADSQRTRDEHEKQPASSANR